METNSYKNSNNRKMEWNKAYFVAPTTYVKPSITYPADAFKYEPLTGKWFTLLPDDQKFYKLTLYNDVSYGIDVLPEIKDILNTEYESGSEQYTVNIPAINNGQEFSFLVYTPSNLQVKRDNATPITITAGLYRISYKKGFYLGTEYRIERITSTGKVTVDSYQGVASSITFSFAGKIEKSENRLSATAGTAEDFINSTYPNSDALVDSIISAAFNQTGINTYKTDSVAQAEGFMDVDQWMVDNGYGNINDWPFNASAKEVKRVTAPNATLPSPPEHCSAPAFTTYYTMTNWFSGKINLGTQLLDWYYYNIEIVDVSIPLYGGQQIGFYMNEIKKLGVSELTALGGNGTYNTFPFGHFGCYNSNQDSTSEVDRFRYYDFQAAQVVDLPRSEVKYCGGVVCILRSGVTQADFDNGTANNLPATGNSIRVAWFVVKKDGTIIILDSDTSAYLGNKDFGGGSGYAHYINDYINGGEDLYTVFSETRTYFKIY